MLLGLGGSGEGPVCGQVYFFYYFFNVAGFGAADYLFVDRFGQVSFFFFFFFRKIISQRTNLVKM